MLIDGAAAGTCDVTRPPAAECCCHTLQRRWLTNGQNSIIIINFIYDKILLYKIKKFYFISEAADIQAINAVYAKAQQ